MHSVPCQRLSQLRCHCHPEHGGVGGGAVKALGSNRDRARVCAGRGERVCARGGLSRVTWRCVLTWPAACAHLDLPHPAELDGQLVGRDNLVLPEPGWGQAGQVGWNTAGKGIMTAYR